MTPADIRKIEEKVINQIINDALAAGYSLSVYDGESRTINRSHDRAAILDALFTTDEEWLTVHEANGAQLGNIFLVHGNDGWDVVCDHSVSLEALLANANALADKLSGEGIVEAAAADAAAL